MNPSIFLGDDPREIIRKARALSDDVARILEQGGPSSAELDEAPILDHWAIVARMRPALAGACSGHPLLGDRPFVATTEIYALDPDSGWARTYSCYYRLGRPRHAHGREQ